jgi:7 transmembrane helices usually fused to an inactive transglutaminase
MSNTPKPKPPGDAPVFLLVAAAAAIAVLRLPALPTADTLNHGLSLDGLPPNVHAQLQFAVFVPIGSLVLVCARYVFGLRAFGVFSPILIALGLTGAGYLVGLAFLILALIVVALGIRPSLKRHRLPYVARVSVLLSAVAVLLVSVVLLAQSLDATLASRLAAYPVIALCLVCERFAASVTASGLAAATHRVAVTVGVAVIIALLAGPAGGERLVTRMPELLLLMIAAMVYVPKHLDLRLFASEPVPAKKKRRSAGATKKQAAAGTSHRRQMKPRGSTT